MSKVDARTLRHQFAEQAEETDSDGISRPWEIQDERSDVRLELCNAIRCAAHDGLTYNEIVELFSALSSKETVRHHATGICGHDGVESIVGRKPGPNSWALDSERCSLLRRKFELGEFETYNEAAEWADVSHDTAWRHINGECNHE